MRPASRHGIHSGDDANVNNGSERLPTINPDVKVTSYGFDGTNPCRAQQVGTSVDGTFGIVAHLKDISFFEDLNTPSMAFYRGTNNTENVRHEDDHEALRNGFLHVIHNYRRQGVGSESSIRNTRFTRTSACSSNSGYIRMDLDSNVWKDYESKKNNFKGAVCVL